MGGGALGLEGRVIEPRVPLPGPGFFIIEVLVALNPATRYSGMPRRVMRKCEKCKARQHVTMCSLLSLITYVQVMHSTVNASSKEDGSCLVQTLVLVGAATQRHDSSASNVA